MMHSELFIRYFLDNLRNKSRLLHHMRRMIASIRSDRVCGSVINRELSCVERNHGVKKEMTKI